HPIAMPTVFTSLNISSHLLPLLLHTLFLLFYSYGDHRDLHSFPTRRSSDLQPAAASSPRCQGPTKREGLGSSGSWGWGSYSPLADRKSTRLNSSHLVISYAVFCLKKKKKENDKRQVASGAGRTLDVRNDWERKALYRGRRYPEPTSGVSVDRPRQDGDRTRERLDC